MPTTGRKDATEGSLHELIVRLLRDTRRYVPASIVPAAASLVAVSVFTRIFDAADYGLYSLVLAAVAILNAVLSVWIQQSILRYLPRFKAEGRLDEFVAKSKVVVAVVCLVVGVVFLAVYFIARGSFAVYEPLYLPALLLLLTEIVFLNLTTLFQADLRSLHFAAYKVTGAVTRLGFAMGFVLFVRRDVTGLLWGAVLGQLVLILPMWRSAGISRLGASWRAAFDTAVFRRFAAYGIPLIGWALGGEILGLSDRFVIGAFRGSAEVGVYSASYRLVYTGFGLVSAPLLVAAHPLIIDAWEKRRDDKLPSVISSFSRFYILLALPVVAVVSVLGEEIAQLILGPEFREGYRIMPWVLGGASVWGLAMYGHKGLELAERTRLMLFLVAAAAGANIVLNLLFVPRYGYYAAAVTTFVCYLTYPILVYAVTRSTMRWQIPWVTLGRTALAALAAVAAVIAVKRGLAGRTPVVALLAVGAVVGVAVYVLFLRVTGELSRREDAELLRGK